MKCVVKCEKKKDICSVRGKAQRARPKAGCRAMEQIAKGSLPLRPWPSTPASPPVPVSPSYRSVKCKRQSPGPLLVRGPTLQMRSLSPFAMPGPTEIVAVIIR